MFHILQPKCTLYTQINMHCKLLKEADLVCIDSWQEKPCW